MTRIIRTEAADAPDSRSTSYAMALGERFEGRIGLGDTGDTIAVQLVAGQSYVILAGARNGSVAGLDDPTLTLYSATGAVVAQNDDVSPSNRFPLMQVTAPATGTYYIDVAGFDGSRGDYYVEVASSRFSIDDVVTQLTEFGWGNATPVHFDVAPGDSIGVNIAALTASGQQLALWALEAWSAVSGIAFVQTLSPNAQILFDDNRPGAFGGPTNFNPITGVITQSSVDISTGWLQLYGVTIDSYSYQTYLHEIGHALGLFHSGNYDGLADYGIDNHFVNDTFLTTVMSYFDPGEVGADSGTVLTPMLADVAAIWSLYGTPAAVQGGNTVWGVGGTAGGVLGQVLGHYIEGKALPAGLVSAAAEPILVTLTDTGGRDTLNLSVATGAQTVNLAPGSHSDVLGQVGNLTIGHATIIENVIGGMARDTVLGNVAANLLEGRGGNDRLEGRGGNDVLVGGPGDDRLHGDAGDDRLFGGGLITTGGAESGQIFRLYQTVLGRSPDSGGHAAWTAELLTGSLSLSDVTARFIASSEFQRVYGGTSNEQFVTLMYTNVLGRAPDAAGLAAWLTRLETGGFGRVDVVRGFSESREFVNRSAPALEAFETPRTQTDWSDEVFRLYQATLGRAPDPGGFETWTQRLADGMSLSTAVGRFLESAEFRQVYGGLDTREFVTLLYANVLGRAPDAGGLATWIDQIDTAGMSRTAVVQGFAQSREFVVKSAAALKDFAIAQSGGAGQDDVLFGGAGRNDLYGGMLSDTFLFDAGQDGVNIVQDFEPWDLLAFQGFGYGSDAQARARMVQEGDDVVFADQGVTVRIEDMLLSALTDELILI